MQRGPGSEPPRYLKEQLTSRVQIHSSQALSRSLLLFATFVVLLYGVVYPNYSLLVSSFQQGTNWTAANYREVLAQRIVLEALVNSVVLSIATVALCAIVGVSLAFLFEGFDFPGQRFFSALAALPLVLPPLVGTVAFIFLFGESGILAHFVQQLFHLQTSPWTLRGWPALLFFHTYTMYPFFYVLAGAGLRRIDASLAEAARGLGGTKSFVLTRVLLPQLTPSLIAAALLTFMTSMASFSAPLLFGGTIRILTLEIFTARQRGDVAMSVTETVILAVISLAALIVFQRYEGTRRFVAAALKGATRRRDKIRSGKLRVLAMLGGILFSVALVLPVVTLVIVSFSKEGSWTTQTLPSAYTISNYQKLIADPEAVTVLINSLVMSAIAAIAALLWSFCFTILLTRTTRKKWRRLLSAMVLVPWALPGTVVAVEVAEAYGQPSWLLGSFVLVGTFWILPFIYFLRFMPLVVRSLQASMEQVDPTLEEAASSLGARSIQRFLRVTLPLVWPGAVAGTLLAFVIALGEYVASVIVYVPANRPISIAIASELRDFNLGAAAAYGVVLILIIAISMTVAGKLERLRD